MSNPSPPERPSNLPVHPETEESTGAEAHANRGSWAMVLLFGVIAALIVVILVLHATGVVGPGGRG